MSAQKIKDLIDHKKYQRASYKSLFLLQFLRNPHYGYLMYQAVQQALALKYKEISVIEFGVADGNGLSTMENHAHHLERLFGIKIQIHGFDTAEGLPQLEDYRDVMHQWKFGAFAMDANKLRARLKRSTLVLGNVKDTIGDFYKQHSPAPIGAISFDVDLYSSTRDALKIFDTDAKNLLPRTRCYFDDVIGNELALTNEFMGEKLAITEYNAVSEARKITPVYHLHCKQMMKKWYHKAYAHHQFDHPRYNDFIAK